MPDGGLLPVGYPPGNVEAVKKTTRLKGRKYRVVLRALDHIPPQNRVAGLSSDETLTIEMDLTHPHANPVEVFLHEQMHLEHWDWPEHKVRRHSRQMCRDLTQAEALAILRQIMRRATVYEP